MGENEDRTGTVGTRGAEGAATATAEVSAMSAAPAAGPTPAASAPATAPSPANDTVEALERSRAAVLCTDAPVGDPNATYTMKQACELTGLFYETLKYYCKEGLVPNVRRDRNNRRIFSGRNVAWIRDLVCLRNCGLGIDEMHRYLELCLEGAPSIPARRQILAGHRAELEQRIAELEGFIDYIDRKDALYRGFLAGEIPYTSNLID